MFGSVNALFSGLAFAGVIYAIYLQREDLKLQQSDLKLQREELRLTREELNKTTEAHLQANEHSQEQMRLNNLPVFKIYSSPEVNKFQVSNVSQHTAFDTEVHIIRVMREKSDPMKQFAKKYCEQYVVDQIKRDKARNIWGFEETYRWNIWSSQQELYCQFIKAFGFGLLVIVQFRDALNNNYVQYVRFNVYETGELRESKNVHFKTSVPTLSERFNIREVETVPAIPRKFLLDRILKNCLSSDHLADLNERDLGIFWHEQLEPPPNWTYFG